MPKTPWTPWHQVVTLRDDLKSGALALSEFAADLYDVALQRGTRPVYEDPRQFFSLTYPTTALRELARDVVHRLAARNQKAVRQLELTYGGGKTHTLITLFHLANDPEALPDVTAVREFKAQFDIPIPKARIAVLPFDKIDVEKGMVARSPSGEERMLRKPWSILAWQIAGADGLRLLHAEDKDEERQSAPAENLLRDLLDLPGKDGLATLVLLDEVLMFARSAVDVDTGWTERLKNFFQALTQAATKIDRCAVVASLLATDPRMADDIGRQITAQMYDIFRREKEQGVEPVGKRDVAEVLRRRFFTPESIADRSKFRAPVIEALKGITDLDDETRKSQKEAEERFLYSYPFHPDLTEVFYAKWTQLQGFQRTRGVLRTFALALRDAESWDLSPLVGPNVFLNAPGVDGVSEGARELTQIATVEEYEGKRQDWTAILTGELDKARLAQQDYSSVNHREVEQAVMATFLHSQPIGQKALLRELLVLIGSTRPDKIEVRKALRDWFDRSWFLDESQDSATKAEGGVKPAPTTWRLGSRPNLKQMHADAVTSVPDVVVDAKLLEAISKTTRLRSSASMSVRVHMLPDKPAMVDDDGEFRYVVLGPAAASDSGKPSAYARRFLDETTAADRPRTNRNAIVLAVPSRDGVEAARQAVREHLGWLAVKDTLERDGHKLDYTRQQSLDTYTSGAASRITDAIVQAYCIVVTVSDQNQAQAFKVQVGDGPLFTTIKGDARARIQETAISPDAMLPGGPYDLWRENEDARWVKDLVGAFAQKTSLPKMLNRQAIVDTVLRGCDEGYFVARLRSPDGSVRTWWRQRIDDAVLDEPLLELVLPEKAELTALSPAFLRPGGVDELWPKSSITVASVYAFLDGSRIMTVSRGGYDEPVPVPRASRSVVEEAIRSAVRDGMLWLTTGPASLLGEDVSPGLLTDGSELQAPPEAIPPIALLPDALPEAWKSGRTTALSLSAVLSQRAGRTLPWMTVRKAIDGGFASRVLERVEGGGAWPCGFAEASAVLIQLPAGKTGGAPGGGGGTGGPPPPDDTRVSTPIALRCDQLQDLTEVLPRLIRASVEHELSFKVSVAIKGEKRPKDDVVKAINELLKQVREGWEVG